MHSSSLEQVKVSVAVVLCIVSLSQVCSVLESLEQEYKREEDWCGGADKLGPNSESDHVTPMISKHLEQKEAFLKVRISKCLLNPQRNHFLLTGFF